MHAVDLARVLQVRRVVLPVAAGVFSALGLLFSNLEMNETVPFLHLAEDAPLDEAEHRYAALAERIAPWWEGRARRSSSRGRPMSASSGRRTS